MIAPDWKYKEESILGIEDILQNNRKYYFYYALIFPNKEKSGVIKGVDPEKAYTNVIEFLTGEHGEKSFIIRQFNYLGER